MAASKSKEPQGNGPWWVRDPNNGHQFATYLVSDGLEVLSDESPWDRSGGLRVAEPGGVKPAEAATEGNNQ